MASGYDKISNGLFLGLAVGLLVMYAATLQGSILSFWNTWMTSLANWLMTMSWMSWATAFASKLNYVLSALIGAIIGAYIDAS